MQGHLYCFGNDGHIFCFRRHPDRSASPTFSMLGIAIADGAVDGMVDGQAIREQAILVAPSTSQVTTTTDPIVVFVFYPHTETHRAIARMPPPRLRPIERATFAQFDDRLLSCMRGTLPIPEAERLFLDVSDVLACIVPPAPRLSRHIVATLDRLEADPKLSVVELAHLLRLSPGRLSHLFSQAVGMDMRRYRRWLKLKRFLALMHTGRNFGELAQLAGFADASHLSRSISEVFGAPASQLGGNLKIHVREESATISDVA